VTRPHIVVSHSLGTVIAYDCLKRIPECPAVDGLITLGCPLGLDEIQDKLQPGWTRADGFLATG
jgi:pimeloyl-ACP methyl ester carboxylesterase